jgi:hypothetical protein
MPLSCFASKTIKASQARTIDFENLKRFQLSLNQRGFTGGVFSDSYVDAAFGKG